MNSGCGQEREPTVTMPPPRYLSIEARGVLKSRRRRSSAKPTIRQTTPKQNIASATLSAGPRAKPRRSMSSAPLRFVVGVPFTVMLTQATHAGGCHAEDGTRGNGAAGQLQDLAGRDLARLAPCAGRQGGIETALVPKSGLGAADTPVSGFDGETDAAIPLDRRAGVVRGRALAPEFVQAPAVARPFIVKGLGEFTLVVERPPIAAVVDGGAEEDFRDAGVRPDPEPDR